MKKMNLPSLIFNIVETILLILMAYLLKVSVVDTFLIFLTFEISRAFIKMPKHYKDWKKCLCWTLTIFTSLFVVSRVDISVGIMCAVFTAYILSGKADLDDMYMWKSIKSSKYVKLDDYIKFNGLNKELLEVEQNLKTYDSKLYMIYLRRFRENKTFEEIREEFDMDNPRINEAIDKVYTLMTFNLKI